MKKTIALMLALLVVSTLVCALTACTGRPSVQQPTEVVPDNTAPTETEAQQPQEETPKYQEFQTFIADYVDLGHYKEPGIDDNECHYVRKSEYNTPLSTDGVITIADGLKITTGKSTADDLLADGWQFSFELTEDSKINPHISVSGYELTKGNYEIRIGLVNESDKAVHIKDAKISYVVLAQYDSWEKYSKKLETAVDFELDDSITQDSNLGDIIRAYGEPVSIAYVTQNGYSYINLSYKSIILKTSADGSCIYEVSHY